MVRQQIVDVDIKKMKMAKQVLAVLSVMGITEENLDNLVNLEAKNKELKSLICEKDAKIATLEARISKLEDFVNTYIKEANARNAKEATNSYKPFSKVEDFRLDGKAR